MKTSLMFKLLKTGILFLLFLVISPELKACESCNRSFLNTLLEKDNFNSLISKELRTAIAAQSNKGESPTKWVNDVLAMNNLTVTDLSPATLNEIFAGEPSPVSTPSYSNVTVPVENQGLEFFDVIRRDKNLPLPATSYVPQNTRPDKFIRITLEEGDTYIGNGVIYKGFTIDKKIPGPTVIVQEGDIVSIYCCERRKYSTRRFHSCGLFPNFKILGEDCTGRQCYSGFSGQYTRRLHVSLCARRSCHSHAHYFRPVRDDCSGTKEKI